MIIDIIILIRYIGRRFSLRKRAPSTAETKFGGDDRILDGHMTSMSEKVFL